MFGWITSFIERTGYFGVALLMFTENVFPPIPSELIMPLAGFNAAQGEMSLIGVIAAGSVGSLGGALLWYYLGKWIGSERLKRWSHKHGRWLTLTPKEFDQACHWFERHGGKAVLIGRLVPAVRTLISVPAGVTDMPMGKFLLYSSIGTVVWTAFLTLLGFWLGDQYTSVQSWLNPVSNVIAAGLVGWYLYRVATFRRRTKSA